MPFLPLLAKFWFVIPIALLCLSTAYYKHSATSEHAKGVEIQASYDNFKARVDQLGKAQEEQNKVTVANQQRITNEAAKAADARVAAVMDRYRRLLNAPANPGSGSLPPVPDTARPVDDSARDQRLLEVLRAADLQTGQLIELQEWIKAAAKP